MNIFKKRFLFNKKSEINKDFSPRLVDQYIEIAKIVKEARIQQNLTIKELSYISKIPERIIDSIEINNKNIRPEYPFIRSILIKLEECLVLKILICVALRAKIQPHVFLFCLLACLSWLFEIRFFSRLARNF